MIKRISGFSSGECQDNLLKVQQAAFSAGIPVKNIQFVLVIFKNVYYNEETKLKGGTLEWHM